MTNQRSGPPAPTNEPGALMGWLKDFFNQFVLAWRLMLDGRVPIYFKIIPFVTIAYLISPVDLAPDMFLGLGQLDDIAVLLIGLRMFIDLCPPDLVEEHKVALTGEQPGVWKPSDTEIIDVEARPVEKDALENKPIEEEMN